jgi:hypothetical protein
MNWLITVSNIAFASIAALLCVLSWKTLKNIKYLNVGKSFWIPAFVSGLLFAIGSIISIINELVLSLTVAAEIVQITELIAFCSLSVGIYTYSKMIRKNLPDKYIIQEAKSTKNDIDAYIASTRSSDKPTTALNNATVETFSRCNHGFGYLSTFPDNASLPEECLSCDRIMDCKHS